MSPEGRGRPAPAGDGAPRVGVAVPTYRREGLLRELLATVPPQWRAWVSDNDASLAPLPEGGLGPGVVVSHAPTLVPMFANWNRALSLVDASVTHVLVPSDDDLFLPAAHDAVRSAVQAHPDADILVFGCDLVDEHGRVRVGYRPRKPAFYGPGEAFAVFRHGVDARMPGVVVKTDLIRRIGAFDERFQLTAADSDFIQRAMILGRCAFVPTVIGLYRTWAGSLTHARQASDEWMREIDLWTDKVAALLETSTVPALRRIDVRGLRDEIRARNISAALGGLIARGLRAEAAAFAARHPIPPRATARTTWRLRYRHWRIARMPA